MRARISAIAVALTLLACIGLVVASLLGTSNSKPNKSVGTSDANRMVASHNRGSDAIADTSGPIRSRRGPKKGPILRLVATVRKEVCTLTENAPIEFRIKNVGDEAAYYIPPLDGSSWSGRAPYWRIRTLDDLGRELPRERLMVCAFRNPLTEYSIQKLEPGQTSHAFSHYMLRYSPSGWNPKKPGVITIIAEYDSRPEALRSYEGSGIEVPEEVVKKFPKVFHGLLTATAKVLVQ